jgi:fructoselysine 6-kinase
MALKTTAVCIGDNCIDHYLPPLEKRFVGGNALNVAVHIHQAGIPTAYIGAVGDDFEGRQTVEKLRKQGIDVSYVQVHPGKTSTTDILLTPEKERQFVHEYIGPHSSLSLSPEELEFILQHTLAHNSWQGGTENYLSTFKQGKIVVSFDYGERYSQDFLDRTISNVDLAFFSATDVDHRQAKNLAIQMAERGPRLVVVTMGHWGSLAYDGAFHFQSAFPADVVDTLGAGDTYIGVFLAHWIKDESISTCLQEASRAAAYTCTHFGAWEQAEIEVEA